MVATSQHLAAQAGLKILREGGNAIDATIATAAILTVVEPTSNGIGGDSFALVWTNDSLYGLNSSGPAPKNISIEKVKDRGYKSIPRHGFIPVTVPGAPASWAELSNKFGKLPFKKLLEPAIYYATRGFPVSPVTARLWGKEFQKYKQSLDGEQFKYWFDTFAPEDRAPFPGEVWSSPDHASTLQSIAETRAKSFYEGEIAEKIVRFSRENDGFLSMSDLASFKPEWVDPINVKYRGYDIWEIPPNGQGLVALKALNILKGFKFSDRDNIDTFHKQLEAMKLAFADGIHYITDKNEMEVDTEKLLSDSYAETRRSLIGNQALNPAPGKPDNGGTVYLATADNEGNMVSYIQSNYLGFGSGLVVPGTGIALQNRGSDFSLDPEDSNSLKPGKKSYHTIIPGFISKNNKPVGPFGVMGGYMQPQGHVQVIMNMIDFKLNPQAALDAPRWQWVENKKIKVESSFPGNIAHLLADKGHNIEISLESLSFGRGQIICKDEKKNIFVGGTEPRADGVIASY